MKYMQDEMYSGARGLLGYATHNDNDDKRKIKKKRKKKWKKK